jgi:hypothetical protein
MLGDEDSRWRGVIVRDRRYLNNIVEQDHRAIKRRCASMLAFKTFGSGIGDTLGHSLSDTVAFQQALLTSRLSGIRKKFEHFVLVRIEMSRWSPSKVAVEAVGTGGRIAGTAQEQALMAERFQIRDDARQKCLANSLTFKGRQQCEDYDLTRLCIAEGEANHLVIHDADMPPNATVGYISRPGGESDTELSEPFGGHGVLPSAAADVDATGNIGWCGHTELERAMGHVASRWRGVAG